MMTPEDVARANQFREGFDLVDYGEVGLPIFRLTLECVTLARRLLPTIQEFAMRCIAMGEADAPSVASILGLKPDIAKAALGHLVDSGYATRLPSASEEPAFRLTDAGEARLKADVEEMPQDETLVIDYDGIRRIPIRLAGETVMKASEVKGIGAIEIRPYPADAPPVTELSIPEVAKVVRRQSGDEFRRTVLALKRVGRRANLFREAVGLVYAAHRGDEVQIAFAVDGKVSEPHERSFAENGGPRKMGFVKAVEGNAATRAIERLVGKEVIKSMPLESDLVEARREEAEALAEVAAIEPAVVAIAPRARRDSEAGRALQAAEQRVSMAKHALASYPVRPLACFEQDELLDLALGSARRSLLITSAGLQASVVTGFRLRAIDQLLERGVRVDVGTYLTPSTQGRGGNQYDPLAELAKRAERGSLQLRMISRSDFYFLIADDELAIISNRPFLGDVTRRTSFMRVAGLVARDRRLVADIIAIAQSKPASRRRKDG